MNEEFKKLSDIEHVLECPQMYIGSMDYVTKESFIYDDGKFTIKQYSYIPSLIKIVDEIIDNAVDSAIRSNFKCNKIKIEINSESVRVIDNGPGIPVIPFSDEDKRYLPTIAWTQMRAGTSFNKERQTIGAHGLGSVATNIFSKNFMGISNDGKYQCIVRCSDNLSHINSEINKTTKTGVEVYFEPDWSKFNITKFDQTHINLIYQRILNLSICFPKITFWFNKEKIKLNPKNFINMFNEHFVSYEDDNIILGIVPNNYDDFKYYSYVNGIKLVNGGNHIDIISNEIITRIREKLNRKCKGILPGDIKNKLTLIVFFNGFKNPKFDSQTKERLTNSNAEINEFIRQSSLNYDNLVKNIIKKEEIINNIIETFQLKEELKLRKNLKSNKKKKFKSDKFLSAIDENKYLLLVEGFSAMSGLSSSLGRHDKAYYALRGLPLNAYDSSLQKIISNEELTDISHILDLTFDSETNDKINFDKIVIASDADYAGIRIYCLLIGLFYRFGRNLFNDLKIYRLNTPIVYIENSKGKIVKYFMTLDEFNEYEKNNKLEGRVRYTKGLGSWTKEKLRTIIDAKGFEYFLEPAILTEDSIQYIDWWLNSDKINSDKRKEFIQQYNLDINLI